MSDFEDDLSESEVSQTEPPKKPGLNLPKVSMPVLLGTGLLALIGSVGVWLALSNPAPAPIPDPVTAQTQSVTQPTTTPAPTTPTTGTTASGTGVETGNIPLMADKPKPATTTTTAVAKPTAKPAIKPAPKPAAPRVVNPFAPLPQSNTQVVAANSGNQSNAIAAVFQPQPVVSIPRPTATPQVIKAPNVSFPFAPRPTINVVASGTTTPLKPVPSIVVAQRPVIPKVLIIKTPQASVVTTQARPPASTPVANSTLSITPTLLATAPRTQAPIQVVTPTPPVNTTNTNSGSNGSIPSITQTPSATAATNRPTTAETPVFKIEPAPTKPVTPPTTKPVTPPATPATPTTPVTTPPITTTPTTSVTTPITTNTTPVATPNTNVASPTTPVNTTPNTSTTPTVNTTPLTNPSTNTNNTNPTTPNTTEPTTSNPTPANPTTPTATTPITTPPDTTVTTIPVAPTADMLELRRVVQDDLRLEYAGFSIGTVKKAFFQSSRGLLSIAEGDSLVRDSNVILKSVSPTEVVLALGNELLTLPLVKR
jgi:hypothetical protein